MNDFENTTSWNKKNESTIIYPYENEGKQHEAELEKEPHGLSVEVEKFSVIERRAWTLADRKNPESTAGFKTTENIKIIGRLDHDRVHAFFLDKTPTVTLDRIVVSIFPDSLETLQASSIYDRWSFIGNEERPEKGLLDTEFGRVNIIDADEFSEDASLEARLYLDHTTFDAVVQKIKDGGTIETAQLEILADLFRFRNDGEFVSHYSPANYGLLCENSVQSTKYYTKARLQVLSLKWSRNLTKPMAETVAFDQPPFVQDDSDQTPSTFDEHLANRVAADVKQIRARIDIFFQVAIGALVFLAIRQFLDWIGLAW